MVRNEDEGGQAEVVGTCHEERPRVCKKKDDGNGVTGKEEKRETKEKIFRCSERRYGGSWCEGHGRQIQDGLEKNDELWLPLTEGKGRNEKKNCILQPCIQCLAINLQTTTKTVK